MMEGLKPVSKWWKVLGLDWGVVLLSFGLEQIGRSVAPLPVIKANSLCKTRDHPVLTVGNGDPMHGVYPTQDTSRMETARVKEEEGADTRIIDKE